MNIEFKKLKIHLLSILIIIAISAIYFSPQLKGYTTNSGDAKAGIGKQKELRDYKEKTGEVGLWAGSLFSGMPAYQVGLFKNNNMFKYVNSSLKLFIPGPIGAFVMAMLIFYLSLSVLKIDPLICLLAAFAFSFNTYNLMIYEAGHFGKVFSVTTMLPIIISIFLLFKKKYFNGFVLFTFSLSLHLLSFHIQMTYYLAIFIAIYIVFELVKLIKKKDFNHIGKIIGLLILGSVLALSTSASKTLSIREYAQETMRGKPVLKIDENKTATSSSETDGLEWNYAMSWSNGLMDLIAVYIPGVVGGSSNQPISRNSNTYKEFKKFGQKLEYAPLYWGAIGSASGPSYNGAVIILFLILGLFILPNKYRFGFGIAILVAFAISLGKNFEVFNRLLYNFLPMYSKFRAHSSVMAIVPVLTVLLAILTLTKIVKAENKDVLLKKLYISVIILTTISLFFGLFGSSFFSFEAASDARYAGSQLDVSVFVKDRIALMRLDSFRSLFFVLVAAALVYLYLKNKLKKNMFLIAILFLSTIDIWSLDKRYFNEDDFVKKSKIRNQFVPTNADKQILKDKDPHYRVFNQTQNPFNENNTSYFHNSIGGYHPAKLQRYQDIIDRHLLKGNMQVFNMLNTKYFITQKDKKKAPIAQQNSGALGNAWFVSKLNYVNTANEEIDALNSINTKTEAVINTEFKDLYLHANIEVPKNASIKLDKYTPNVITYSSSNDNTSLAVFSEVWYSPSKGWKAYIDNKETELIRANYVLRALIIPAGKHQIKMIFDPKSLKIGDLITLITSSLIILLAIFAIFKNIKSNTLIEE